MGKRACHAEALRAVLSSSDFRSSDLDHDSDDVSHFTIQCIVRKTLERLIQVQGSKVDLEKNSLGKLEEKDRELSEANDIIRKRFQSDELMMLPRKDDGPS